MKGVVWTVPEDPVLAMGDLRQMREIGVEAVRTGLIEDEQLLTLADTLGLQLYQEVLVDYLPASHLRDTALYAKNQLQRSLTLAQNHPSARHFGLARRSDTSDPSACPYFEEVARYVREQGPPGSQVYYLASFAEDDRCAGTVDFVLLDALNTEDPLRQLQRRRDALGGLVPDSPAGIGALGTYVDAAAGRGLLHPHSPEVQARFLEDTLGELLTEPMPGDTMAVRPSAVFVYRWRDETRGIPFQDRGEGIRQRRSFGLLEADGTKRPAHAVVEGFFTGRQTVFAFPSGTPPTPDLPWLTLLGWGVVAMLGVSYAYSARFRRMVPRYFMAHGFYRDAVREGRDLLDITNSSLLVALAICIGMVAAAIVQVAEQHEAFLLLLSWLPDSLHEIALTFLDQAWLLVLTMGGFYMAEALLWAGILALISRRRLWLAPGQTLVLVTWPRWTFGVLMVGALVLGALPPAQALVGVSVLIGAWLMLHLYAMVRTLHDFTAVARVSLPLALAAFWLNPLMLLLVLLFFAGLQALPELAFLWHLVTRT